MLLGGIEHSPRDLVVGQVVAIDRVYSARAKPLEIAPL